MFLNIIPLPISCALFVCSGLASSRGAAETLTHAGRSISKYRLFTQGERGGLRPSVSSIIARCCVRSRAADICRRCCCHSTSCLLLFLPATRNCFDVGGERRFATQRKHFPVRGGSFSQLYFVPLPIFLQHLNTRWSVLKKMKTR